MINGKRYSWEDISINLPHGEIIGIDSIEYSDGKEIEAQYGKGSNPLGYGAGNYSAEGKMSLDKEEYARLLDYVKKQGKSFYMIPPFPITVSYANEDQGTQTDELRACMFKKRSESHKQGDKNAKVELEFLILDGIWQNGVAPN